MLSGLGPLGVRTLEELSILGEDVVVIAAAATDRDVEAARGSAHGVIQGSPRDPEVLTAAGVARARAVIFTDDDDLGNIDAALAAHELNGRARLVVRIFDVEFGRRIERLFPDAVALSASALAAPGFVSAVLEEGVDRRIDILGRWFAVGHSPVDAPGVVLPLARASEDGRLEAFPSEGRDVVCLMDASGASPPGSAGRLTLRHARGALVAIRALALGGDARLRYLAALFLGLTLFGGLLFAMVAGTDFVEGLFNTTNAFFGGVSAEVATSPGVKLFSVVLTLFGAAAVATFYAVLADAVLASRLSRVLGPTPRGMHDHVVICGLGTIGFGVAQQLRALGIPVAAVELQPNGRFLAAARDLGIAVLTGDATQPETFKALSLERARCLLAATDSDASNIEIALLGRALRTDLRVVVRLFDAHLADRLEHAFGEFISRSSSRLAAPAFAAAALGRRVIATIPVGPRVLVVAQVPIEADAPLDGATVAAAERVADCRILAVSEGEQVHWNPAPEEPLRVGRSAIVVGSRRNLSALILQAVADSAHRGWSVGFAIIRR